MAESRTPSPPPNAQPPRNSPIVYAEDSSQEPEIQCGQPRDEYDEATEGFFESLAEFGANPQRDLEQEDEDDLIQSTQETEIATQMIEEPVYRPTRSGGRTRPNLRNENNKPWRRDPVRREFSGPAEGDPADPLPSPVGDYYDLEPTQILHPSRSPTSRNPSTEPNGSLHQQHDEDLKEDEETRVQTESEHEPAPLRRATHVDHAEKDVFIKRATPIASLVETSVDQSPAPRGSLDRETTMTTRKKRKLGRAAAVPSHTSPESEDQHDNVNTSLKRKRGRSTRQSKAAPRTSSPTNHKPRLRQTRHSTNRNRLNAACAGQGTRVFALWEQNRVYYSGFVLNLLTPGLYTIQFDDGNEGPVPLANLRRCTLHPGDIISAPGWHRCTVDSAEGYEPDSQVQVTIRRELVHIPLRSISIESNTIADNWEDRLLSADDVTVAHKEPERPRRKASAMSSKVLHSSRSSRASGNLNGTAFILTISHDVTLRVPLQKKITSHGGHVLDWSDFIHTRREDRYTTKDRWIVKQNDLEYADEHGFKRIILLADGFVSTTKFLTAIALGVPCMSVSYVDACIEGDPSDWTGFLLPQGQYRGIQFSQSVDLSWFENGNIERIKNNPLPPKILSGKKILVVGKQLILPPVKGEQTVTPIPHIMLAMGANSVEAVRSIQHALKPLKDYDLLVAQGDRDIASFEGHTPVSWSWIKESLVLGREAPMD